MTSELRPCCDYVDINLIISLTDDYYYAYLKCFGCGSESDGIEQLDPKVIEYLSKISEIKKIRKDWNRSLEQTL
jgi:hypothetical protein